MVELILDLCVCVCVSESHAKTTHFQNQNSAAYFKGLNSEVFFKFHPEIFEDSFILYLNT